MSEAVRTCAGAILVRAGELLLAKRSAERTFYPGVWDVIGGHCEEGESPTAALIREVKEEIGVIPTDFDEIAILAEPLPEKHGDARYHIFIVTAWDGGEPRLQNREHSDLRWLSVARALSLQLAHPGYIELLRTIAAQRTGGHSG